MGAKLGRVLLDRVAGERAGGMCDRGLMRSACGMLSELGRVDGTEVYRVAFEDGFLAETAEFYRAEMGGAVAAGGTAAYVARATARIAEEHERVGHYLVACTAGPLGEVLDRELVTAHHKALVADPDGAAAALCVRGDASGVAEL